jgi:hypothetical protein
LLPYTLEATFKRSVYRAVVTALKMTSRTILEGVSPNETCSLSSRSGPACMPLWNLQVAATIRYYRGTEDSVLTHRRTLAVVNQNLSIRGKAVSPPKGDTRSLTPFLVHSSPHTHSHQFSPLAFRTWP